MLRNQVRQSKYNIRWLAGTVTGFHISESDNSRIKAVTVRAEGASSEIQLIEAALVVGESCSELNYHQLMWTFSLQIVAGLLKQARDGFLD